MTSSNRLTQLPEANRNALESLLMDFEQNWSPDLLVETYRKIEQQIPESFGHLAVSELVKIDLQRRWSIGRGWTIENYLQQFPRLGSAESIEPELILVEYNSRKKIQHDLKLDSYVSRFPEQMATVKILFDAQRESRMETGTPSTPPGQASIETSRMGHARDTKSNQTPGFAELPAEFGRYRILRELGSGAMGTVYLAHDSQLDRQVALKTPSFQGEENEELVTRFYREARSAAKIHHRNICPIFDVGEIDGQLFISMAFIKGRPMSELIQPDKLPPEKTSAVLVHRLALALAEAHRHNVIHRDLKPANIMIDKKREPVVMDFGLARQTDIESRMTQSGMLLGTPAYMSPEQLSGEPDDVGKQADIYALGVILYELLTGRLPFNGSLAQIVCKILQQEPTRPSQVRKEISPRLEEICAKMMAKDQAVRFQTMDEVAAAIKELLAASSKRTSAESRDVADDVSPETSSRSSDSISETGALNEYFAAQAANDPRQTSLESIPIARPLKPAVAVQPDIKKLKPVHPKAASGNGFFPSGTKWIAAGLVAALLLSALGIVFYFSTPYGTIRVETVGELDGLEVLVDGHAINLAETEKLKATDHDLQLKLGDEFLQLQPGSQQFVLPGEGSDRKLSVSVGAVSLASEKFTVARNKETILTIELLPNASNNSSKPPGNGSLPKRSTTPLKSATNWGNLIATDSLSGWEIFGQKGWSVAGGVLTGEPLDKQSVFNSWLARQGEFENFECEFEYKLEPGGNSGVFVRAVRDPELTKKEQFYEIQLLDDTASRFAKTPAKQLNGSLWSKLPASPSLRLRPNQWQRMKFRVDGDQLQVWSNDQKVVDGKLPPIQRLGTQIGLQLHTGKIQFRNMRIRELNSKSGDRVSNKSSNVPDSPAGSGETAVLEIKSNADSREMAISPDGKFLATTGEDTMGQISIWDTSSGKEVKRIRVNETGGVADLFYSADGRRLIFCWGDSVHVVDSANGERRKVFEFPTPVQIAAFPDRNWIAGLYYQKQATKEEKSNGAVPQEIRIWDWDSGEILVVEKVKNPGSFPPVYFAGVSPDGKHLTVGARHNQIRYEVEVNGSGVALVNQTDFEQTSLVRGVLAISPDGQFAATPLKNENGLFAVFEFSSGRVLQLFDPENASRKGPGCYVAFTPDSRGIVSSDYNGRVKLWNVASGKLVRELQVHGTEKQVHPPGLIVTPDGRVITGGDSSDRTIKISKLPTHFE